MKQTKLLAVLIVFLSSLTALASQRWTPQTLDKLRNDKVIERAKGLLGKNELQVFTIPRKSGEQVVVASVPEKEEGTIPRPLIVVLDGSEQSVRSISSLTRGLPIVVGLPASNRISDYVLPLQDGAKPPKDNHHKYILPTSNNDHFTKFVADTVVPVLEKKFGPFGGKVLWGYSHGGHATTNFFLTRPEVFDAYIAGSPSIYAAEDEFHIRAELAAENPERYKNKCMVLAVGSDDGIITRSTRDLRKKLEGLHLPLASLAYGLAQRIDHASGYGYSFDFGWDAIFKGEDSFPEHLLQGKDWNAFDAKIVEFEKLHSCMPINPLTQSDLYTKAIIDAAKNGDTRKAMEGYQRHKALLPSIDGHAFVTRLAPMFENLPKKDKDSFSHDYLESYLAILDSNSWLSHYGVHVESFEIFDYLNQSK